MNLIIQEDAQAIANSDLYWDKLNGKTVLISGANGYVPSYFVHAFIARNDMYNEKIKVIALCRNEKKAEVRFSEYLERDDFKLLIQDVCEPIVLNEEVHFFIHAASPAGVRISNIDPVATFYANVLGCKQMLELSKKNKTEGFLLLSSIDVYGKPETKRRFIESDNFMLDSLNPRNVYACAKRAAESLCTCYYVQYKTPVIIARPSQIMGPGIALDDGRLHADFISQMLTRDTIILKSDGTAVRTFIYITDAVIGMLVALTKGVYGEAYNVADENGELSVFGIAQLMASLETEKKVDVVFDYEKRNAPEVTHALSVVTADAGKLRLLGWQPKYIPKETAERTLRYFRNI